MIFSLLGIAVYDVGIISMIYCMILNYKMIEFGWYCIVGCWHWYDVLHDIELQYDRVWLVLHCRMLALV